MRILFIGGWGHHTLKSVIDAGLAARVGTASDGIDREAAQRRSGDGPFYEDYRIALDELKPDVVNVGAVYGHAGPINADCLRRGIKVVTDKPGATTWDQYEQLVQASADGGVLLTEYEFRSRSAFRAARKAIADDMIGQTVLATAQKSYRWGGRPDFYKRRADYGGTVMWIASHGIDAIWYTTGQRMTHVTGHHGNIAKPEYEQMEDHVTALYTLGNGGSAMVHADLLRPAAAPTHGDDRLRIVGTRGQVEIRDSVCTLITEEQPPLDINHLGEDADKAGDLFNALNGDTTHYSTQNSLAMLKLLLVTRDASDQGTWLATGWEAPVTGGA